MKKPSKKFIRNNDVSQRERRTDQVKPFANLTLSCGWAVRCVKLVSVVSLLRDEKIVFDCQGCQRADLSVENHDRMSR